MGYWYVDVPCFKRFNLICRMSSGNESITIQVAKYMVHWAGLSMEAKQDVIHSWARISSYFTSKGTASNSIVYMLPTLGLPEKHLWICQNGLPGLLNIG
eukprot:14930192-Ditylum_brightwellii.AAC.1